jgi:hypothetical protein
MAECEHEWARVWFCERCRRVEVMEPRRERPDVAGLIALAKTWTEGDCSFEHGPTLRLIHDLVAALEHKGG